MSGLPACAFDTSTGPVQAGCGCPVTIPFHLSSIGRAAVNPATFIADRATVGSTRLRLRHFDRPSRKQAAAARLPYYFVCLQIRRPVVNPAPFMANRATSGLPACAFDTSTGSVQAGCGCPVTIPFRLSSNTAPSSQPCAIHGQTGDAGSTRLRLRQAQAAAASAATSSVSTSASASASPSAQNIPNGSS